MFGINGLLVISIFASGYLIWLICPTPSLICLPHHLKFLTLFVLFMGAWLGYEMAGLVFGDNIFSMLWYGASFAGSMWFMPFFSTYGASFVPLEVGYKATRVLESGWIEYFDGQGFYWVLFNLGKVNQWFQYNYILQILLQITLKTPSNVWLAVLTE